MACQSPAVHEGVDGVNKHQQGEQSQSDVHLSSVNPAEIYDTWKKGVMMIFFLDEFV